MKNKRKSKSIISLKRYIYHDKLLFGNDALVCKNKTINKESDKMFVSDSGFTSHMVNSLKI